MENLIKKINYEIVKVFKTNGFDENFAYISISGLSELADYQINSCFNIAKILKKNPYDIATEISALIKDIKVDSVPCFSTCEPSKPGFVNLRINDNLLYSYIKDMLCNENLGISDIKNMTGEDIKTVLLDYGGANVAKPLHVGHLRVAVIGEALKRLYNRLGIKTIADIHLGDYGLQMGLVIEELKDEDKTQSFTIEDLEVIYPKASLRAKGDDKKGIKADPVFSERAHTATKRLQDDLEPELSIWKRILKISIDDLKKRYAELNVSFDYYYGESTVKDIMGPMVDKFIKDGIAHESEGAYVIDVKNDSDKKEMPPCIIRKKDGAILYATSDIATIKFREDNFDADKYIYVVDKRQSLHLEQCFRAARLAKILKRDKDFIHVEVGTMNGPDGKPIKTREGGVVKLESLIYEAKEKAKKAIEESGRDKTRFDEEDIASKIAIAALKYGDLSNSPTKDYIFTLDKFLSFEGNTGPYILYTLVRIKSIFDKISYDGNINYNYDISTDKIIHSIFLKVIRYADILVEGYRTYDPSVLCRYIYELANDFNSFYHEHSIINETDIKKREFYIFILMAIDKIIRDVLNILAIDVPERM